ncbi:MAG TPA: CAP domain-containing protein [Acidimicrobiales bacterium]|nr:CAP domain-containing protein [Acidimicrobiales bacterium]
MNANKALRTVVAIAVFMVVMGGFGMKSASAQTPAGDDPAAGARILELVNRDRVQNGLAPLADRADVRAVAASWSASMAQAQALSHSDDYFSAASHSRLNAKALGENVARNGSVDDAHARLMASPHHYENIMNGAYTVVGIAVFRDDRGTYWVTEDFLTPKGSASAPAAPAAAPAPAPAPKPAAAPKPRTVTPVAAPAPAPAPAPVAPPTTVQQAEAAQATVDTALISAAAPQLGGWNGGPPAPAAAGGTHGLSSTSLTILAAAGANLLVALALVAARRSRNA